MPQDFLNEKAFEELVKLHTPKIQAHIRSIVKDEALAEDLMQETFIAAYRHLDQFEGRAAFSTWLWRIAHNKALSYLRQQKNEPHLEFKEEIYQPKEIERDESVVNELLAHLSKKQEETYRMFFLEKMAQKEIAAKLGIPLGTVRSRIHYAQKKLRKIMLMTPHTKPPSHVNLLPKDEAENEA